MSLLSPSVIRRLVTLNTHEFPLLFYYYIRIIVLSQKSQGDGGMLRDKLAKARNEGARERMRWLL